MMKLLKMQAKVQTMYNRRTVIRSWSRKPRRVHGASSYNWKNKASSSNSSPIIYLRLTSWQHVVDRMPSNIFSFCRRALILALPTKANLKTWNIAKSNICSLCTKSSETQHHMLNNCSRAIEEGRYTWRHDSVLHTMGYHLEKLINKGYEIFIDIPEYNTPGNLFNSQRPDIAFKLGNDVYVVELTVCFETNFEKSRSYKETRYQHLNLNLKNSNHKLKTFYIEFSSLGFCSTSIIELTRLLRRLDVDVKRMVEICSEVCIRTSYYIFNRRDKEWTNLFF